MKIIITAKFGSKFQEEAGYKSLQAILIAWQDFYGKTNKKNKISISYSANDIISDLPTKL